MKAGDVCRCISDFTGISSEELTLYKKDIVQVHEVVDRHWLRGEGGGSVGLVPSSVLVKVDEVPPHPSHLPLFVASAEFMPSQQGDLGLSRGDFVVGLNPIDESWWCGEVWGKKGIFPVNFVWRINKDIIQVEDTSEQEVSLQGRVKASLKAQLPEELDLYAGDIVNITHIVDKDWYRGESNGATGIFPKSFVEVTGESSVPSATTLVPEENKFMVSDVLPSCSLRTGGTLRDPLLPDSHPTGNSAHPHIADEVPPSLEYSSPAAHHSIGLDASSGATLASASALQPLKGGTEPTVRLSNTSAAWKTIDVDDTDLFDDDYFRQNMPSLFSSREGGGGMPSVHTDDTIPSVLSGTSSASASLAITGSRYENVPDSMPPEEPSPAMPSSHYIGELKSDQNKYKNVHDEEPQCLREDMRVLDEGQISDTLEQQKGMNKMNSLSQKVEDYLSSTLLGEDDSNVVTGSSTPTTRHAWAYRGPSYTEDNTGIEPYGRAVFSFKAQYPNELTFKKGEIVHLLQHVDSHWTLGRAGDARGIFPTSYVDIIVDCLHSEEQQFLARSEAAPSYLQSAQAVAQYDFQAVQTGDVSMKRGDSLMVLKEVDTNWVIVENMTGSKGMCPKNYLSFLEKGEAYEAQEPQSQTIDSISDTSEQRSRLSFQDSVHQRSRSSSPFSSSWKRRSYNKDDFGSIKKQDVEPVLARNMASLDSTSKASVLQPEKKVGDSVFIKRETALTGEQRKVESQQNTGKPKPPVLPRQSKIPPAPSSAASDNKPQETADSALCSVSPLPSTVSTAYGTDSTTTAITTSASTTSSTKATISTTLRTGPYTSLRRAPPPLIPSRSKVFARSSSLQSDSFVASVHRPPPSPPQSSNQPQPKSPCQSQLSNQPQPPCQPQFSDQTQTQPHSQPQASIQSQPPSQPQSFAQLQPTPPNKAVYSHVRKTLRSQKKENEMDSSSETQQLNDSPNSTAAFPEDVSQLSVASEATYSSDTRLGSTSAGLVPQRPAPPPPPKLVDAQDQEEQYYSLTPYEPEVPRAHTSEIGGVEKGAEGEAELVRGESKEATEREIIESKENRPSMRRVVVQEIVTTEHEYIQDLEALLKVVQLAPSRPGGTQGVHLSTLLGNITEIVEVAKKFAVLLDQASYGDDEEVCVGRVFLACVEELCQSYKVYCSNHNVTVEPLMQKYEQEPGPAAFLQWVLEELQQHKIQLLDMRSVLIKPLQRVLKYPLFLDRLVRETPDHHPDHRDLLDAKTAMANVAKEINEYTKRLDLVNKYRVESDQSLQSKMQRVSLHSVAKKSARISTLVSEMLGIMAQTKDPEFDEEVARFRSMQRWTIAMAQDIEGLLQGVKARHRAELDVMRGIVDTLLQPGPDVEALHKVAADSAGRLFEMFDNFVRQRVVLPTKQLVGLCEVPDRLILKRNDKLLDYDNAQYKLDRNRDPTRTRILEEELSQVQGTYSALNTQLMMELPVLTSCGLEVLSLATRSFVSARMYLQGHLARLYLNLAQALGLALTDEEDMLTQFRVKYLQQVGEFRQLSFLPADSLQWSLPRGKGHPRKSLDSGVTKREQLEEARTKVVGQYPGEVVYVAREVHTPAEVMELTLYPGDHVALLKNKDPLGRTDRWFVDDGDNKGFVRASCLKPMLAVPEGAAAAAAAVQPPAAASTAAIPSHPVAPATSPRPSTVPRPAPAPPEQAPPRYEDIFPGVPTTIPQGPGYLQAPPPRFSSGGTHTPAPQSPLPSKQDPLLPSSGELEVGEGDYYSPPMDCQPSGEYNSPVSEENNIYEEIDQGPRGEGGEQGVAGESDTSPIYEVIKDGEILQDPEDFPPESTEPQFYYALYNFGGSDATQLSLVAGQVVLVLHAVSSDWWFVEDRSGKQGYVPASYLTRYS